MEGGSKCLPSLPRPDAGVFIFETEAIWDRCSYEQKRKYEENLTSQKAASDRPHGIVEGEMVSTR